MRRNFILIAAAFILAACSPETFTMNIEMRHPSRSGLDLGRKSIAVVYADNGNSRDTLFLRNVAAGFAQTMEEDYYGGQELITLFRTPADTTLSSKESLTNLIMETGSDVVFVFDTPEFGEPMAGEKSAALPFKLKLYAYDSMNKDDQVLSYNGSSAVKTDVTPEDLRKMGAKGIGLDIDNVIAPDGTYKYAEGVREWVRMIIDAGFPVTIISNGTIFRVRAVSITPGATL